MAVLIWRVFENSAIFTTATLIQPNFFLSSELDYWQFRHIFHRHNKNRHNKTAIDTTGKVNGSMGEGTNGQGSS